MTVQPLIPFPPTGINRSYPDVDPRNSQVLDIVLSEDVLAVAVMGKRGSVKGAIWLSHSDAEAMALEILARSDRYSVKDSETGDRL